MNPAGTWLAVQLARRRATGATTMAMHRLRALAAHLVARPEPAAAAAADATPNSPRGTAEQGFGIGWADRAPSDHVQPPVFDPSTELREACEFYAENGFVVVDALSAEECAEMNATADRFLEDTGDAALQEQSGGQGQLFYPLLGSAEDIDRYSAVDKYITHPRTLPVIADVLGGAPAVSAPHPTTTTTQPRPPSATKGVRGQGWRTCGSGSSTGAATRRALDCRAPTAPSTAAHTCAPGLPLTCRQRCPALARVSTSLTTAMCCRVWLTIPTRTMRTASRASPTGHRYPIPAPTPPRSPSRI